jgi:3-phenylpropionate/trans-cinnamate dioxygenase ferredoxin subunit
MKEMKSTRRYVPVARVDDVPPGQARVFEAEGLSLAVSNVEGVFYAIDNVCTHDDGPLGEGRLYGTAIECPRHGARFDVRTGAVLRMPAAFPVKAYPTRVENGQVMVEIEG